MPRPNPLDAPTDCVGWIVVTEITDNIGHVSVQHGLIHRRYEDAARSAALPHKLRIWERAVERKVQPCCTAFPLSDVLAGHATRWGDYLAGEGRVAA